MKVKGGAGPAGLWDPSTNGAQVFKDCQDLGTIPRGIRTDPQAGRHRD